MISHRVTLFAAFLSLVLPRVAQSENDGNYWRSIETAVVSPQLDGSPLTSGIAAVPIALRYGGAVYLTVHLNSFGWTPVPGCHSSTINQGEVIAVYRLPAADPGIYGKASLVGQLSPCEGFLGAGYWGVDGTLAIGGNAKFYATTNRTHCDGWDQGCFDNEYLGASATLGLGYAWQGAPILASSVTPGGRVNFAGFIGLRSFSYDPPPPAALFPRQSSTIGPATLWGYVKWGYVPGSPAGLARVQIVETASTVRPGWQTTRVFLYANDGTWKAVNTDGTFDFTPYDASGFSSYPGDFGARLIDSLYYDTANQRWYGFNHDGDPDPSQPVVGCDERSANWYTNPNSAFYGAPWVGRYSTATLVEMGSPSSPVRFAADTYTQNTLQIGGSVVELGSGTGRQRYLFRGSTERLCQGAPARWWHPWIGAEITVEKLQ